MTKNTTETISKSLAASAIGVASGSAGIPAVLVIAAPSTVALVAPVAIAFGVGYLASEAWDWLVD